MQEAHSLSALTQDTNYGYIDKNQPSQRLYNPVLFDNTRGKTMLEAITQELLRSSKFTFAVAFITSSALAMLKQALLDYQGQGTIYTSTYLGFNEPEMFEELLNLGNIEVRVLTDPIDAFHSKGYIFHQGGQVKTSTAIIGSSNLTRSALLSNTEWNLRFSAFDGGQIVEQLESALHKLDSCSEILTWDWVKNYEQLPRPLRTSVVLEKEAEHTIPVGKISPNAMQQEALEQIKQVRTKHQERALVISATGTGKTILAALAVREARPARVLFLAHREQILNKAQQEFQRVLDHESPGSFGKFVSSQRDVEAKYLFSTIQTLSRANNRKSFAPDHFDYIIIDEVHRAGAESYLSIIEYFEPKFLLGLTATPERGDTFNIYELFDYNVPYEIRLNRALEANMLVPFSYFGVSDYINSVGETIEETADLRQLVVEARVDYLIKMIERYGHARNVRGLMFCSRNKEAEELSYELNKRLVNGKRLSTEFLTSDNSQSDREAAVRRLECGEIDYLLTVDIFNEGVDIPAVNQVVMLRNTKSSIVFTQQLGRGLRKTDGKSHLRVIDFIGNYKNNFLIPIALFGDKTLDKDVIRRQLDGTRQASVLAGVSSVSFEEVALERVLSSLKSTKLDALVKLKEAYLELSYRLGRVPTRVDFARFDTPDPTAFISGSERPSYWHFLQKVDPNRTSAFTPLELKYLMFLDWELLNGKRPHELLLLQELLRGRRVTKSSYAQMLRDYGANFDEQTIGSVATVFSLDFFTDKERERYGEHPIVTLEQEGFQLSSELKQLYITNPDFCEHIDDSVEAGLYLNQHHFNRAGEMQIGKRYSRKDVCRLLNWPGNHESTMYGYKPDAATATCPIFVTYHKDDDIDEAINYQDQLDDEKTLSWFTKHGRRTTSKVESGIIAGKYGLELLIKKDDAEGSDFFYLGKATPRDAIDTTISAGGGYKPIVSMKLDLQTPVEAAMYDYLTAR